MPIGCQSSLRLVVGVLAVNFQLSATIVTEGSVKVPAKSVVFLTKFCFDYNPAGRVENKIGFGDIAGTYDIRLNATPAAGNMQLVLFDDQSESYPDSEALWGFQCGGKRLEKTARSVTRLNMETVERMGTLHMPIVETIRPRWWYVALIDCSGEEHDVNYLVRMVNLNQGWRQEFSMDHHGIFNAWFFLTVYTVLLSVQIRAIMFESSVVRTTHPLRMTLIFCIAVACFGVFLLAVDDLSVAHTGRSLAPLYLVGKFFRVLSKFTLISILLLLSNGHGISRTLCNDNIISVIKLTTPFFGGCFFLETWGEYAQSRTYTTDFVFCTRYGAVLVCADLFLLVVYVHSLYKTQLAELDAVKQSFYRRWGAIYATAFCVLPVSTLIGLLVAAWCRSQVMFVLGNSIHVFLLTCLVLGLWPKRTSPIFCIDDGALVETYGKESDLLPTRLTNQLPTIVDDTTLRKVGILLQV